MGNQKSPLILKAPKENNWSDPLIFDEHSDDELLVTKMQRTMR